MVLPVQKGFINQTDNKSADEVETSHQSSLFTPSPKVKCPDLAPVPTEEEV
jgi:hypothetical protein